MSEQLRLTSHAQEAWTPYLQPGSWAVDATAGNGQDTDFLTDSVSPGGHVFTIDIQELALRATAIRLESTGRLESVTLLRGNHARMADLLPCSARGRIDLICFNLGYLPSGDHSLTTRPETTIPALRASLNLLSSRGALSVMAYRGHPGGMEEAEEIALFMDSLPGPWSCLDQIATGTEQRPGPVWWLVAQPPETGGTQNEGFRPDRPTRS